MSERAFSQLSTQLDTETTPAFRGNQNLQLVWRVLNRVDSIGAMQELYNGLAEKERRPPLDDGARIAFGFDTNAIYRIGLNGTAGANAIDYLRQAHEGPVIVPGQAIQEIWNNALSAIEPQAKKLRSQFQSLEKEMQAIDQELGSAGEAVREALNEFVRVHGDWIDPASQETFEGTLEALLAVAVTSFVPRSEFYSLARVRNDTKTPPGFQDQDDNHGDFYLWADFLYGVTVANRSDFDAVVLVTNDKKSDWSRNSVAHPLLVAEATAVGGVPFRLWTVHEFQTHVKRLLS